MKESSEIDLGAERIESLKAGSLAAVALLLAFGVAAAVEQALHAPTLASTPLTLLSSSAIACFSGFLFGVTYRYVIRTDSNPQLKAGAAIAFGLVRGLARGEAGLRGPQDLWPFAVQAAESVLMFALAALVLDLAIQRGWLKAFK